MQVKCGLIQYCGARLFHKVISFLTARDQTWWSLQAECVYIRMYMSMHSARNISKLSGLSCRFRFLMTSLLFYCLIPRIQQLSKQTNPKKVSWHYSIQGIICRFLRVHCRTPNICDRRKLLSYLMANAINSYAACDEPAPLPCML